MEATLPRRRFMISGPPDSDAVCLTFDDGPHPELTPRLLDVLAESGVRATFFMVGRSVERYPQVVRRILDERHAVGGHSFTHGDPRATSARDLAAEVDRTEELFEKIAGRRSRLFRPPHGKLTPGKLWRLWRGGQSIVLWNVDPKDFECKSAGELRDRLDGATLHGGDVVLLHDTVPHAAQVLPEIIRSARARGLGFTTAADWAHGSARAADPKHLPNAEGITK
jgi:peptidoglycan/xylan/chitin deacetylase (PgdA/CDA1 family)